jgi:hypothetical protein
MIVCPHHYILHIPCCVIEGANGDGMAVVTSLRSFDREQQKEYLIPIVIKDSGNPAMSGTSTLTVVIGDVNDNKMQPGSKDIFVYNYMVSYCSYGINYELVYTLINLLTLNANHSRRTLCISSVEVT